MNEVKEMQVFPETMVSLLHLFLQISAQEQKQVNNTFLRSE